MFTIRDRKLLALFDDREERRKSIRSLKRWRMIMMIMILLGLLPLVVFASYLGWTIYAVNSGNLQALEWIGENMNRIPFAFGALILYQGACFLGLRDCLTQHDFLLLVDHMAEERDSHQKG